MARKGAKHVAIVMDGNGRWAQKRALPRAVGHRYGVEALRNVVRSCPDLGVEILTVYAFSTENWTRPHDEVSGLWRLLIEYLTKEASGLHAQGVRIQTIGAVEALPEPVQVALANSTSLTAQNTRLHLNLALNYGGRDEIVRAMNRILATDHREAVTEADIAEHLDTALDGDPDLIIRCSGEYRLSNFLLWQAAYAELIFTDVLWPDFRPEHLEAALRAYESRDRRFGTIKPGGL